MPVKNVLTFYFVAMLVSIGQHSVFLQIFAGIYGIKVTEVQLRQILKTFKHSSTFVTGKF